MIPRICFTHFNAKLLVPLAAATALSCSVSQAQTVIIDGTSPDYENNGSFESTAFWWGGSATTLSGDLGLDLGVLLRTGPATPSDGTFYTVVAVDGSGTRGVYQDTGYDLTAGDAFNLSFFHGSHNGLDEGDEFTWMLFTTTTDTDGGTVDNIVATGQVAANTSSTLIEQSYNSIGTVTGAMEGDRLFIAFLPSTDISGDYLALDQVNLSTIPEASTYGLILGAFSLALVAQRRRRSKS